MITHPREKCLPCDRNLLAVGVVLGIGGGIALYQGVTEVSEAIAGPSAYTANVTLDAAPTPDPIVTHEVMPGEIAGPPTAAMVRPTPSTPPIVARQLVEAGSAAAPVPGAAPLDLAPEPDLNDVKRQLAELADKYKSYKAATDVTAKRLAWFTMLSLGGKLLVDLLLLLMPVLGARGKQWIPIAALGVGVAVGALTRLAGGDPWLVAIFYGSGPPLAVFINELLKRRKGAATGQPAKVPR